MLIFDTICALSTPPYKSALATIRLSGPKTKEVLSHIIKKDVNTLEPNKAYFVKIWNDGEVVDEVVMTYYQGPKSYTGFDSADFSIHGNMFIVEDMLDTLVKFGARRSERGEFSAQAYYNGKMDLLKAEGINDLINANSRRARKIATETLSGRNSQVVTTLKNELLSDLSSLEYFVENFYDDEDNDDYDTVVDKVLTSLQTNILELSNLIEKTKNANKQYQGFQIAIAGEPNVGKSTLLNALLKEDKAIVSPIPGTTRDVVEGEKEIDGLLFRFKDTAGIRKTDDYVESLGIERSYKTILDADLVLLVSDCGFKDMDNNQDLKEAIQNKPTIKVATKRDLNPNHEEGDLSICSMSDDLTPLIRLILSKLNLTEKEESLFLGKREEEYLIKIQEQVKLSYDALSDTRNIDIVSDTLRVAIAYINDLMGNSESQTMEDIYQTLFSKFCLGK